MNHVNDEDDAASRPFHDTSVSEVSGAILNVPESKSGTSLTRKIVVRLMFLGVSLVLGIAFVEIAGRFLFRAIADDARYYPRLEANVVRSAPILEPTRKPGTFDAKFGYVLTPNVTHAETGHGKTWTVHTNSLGFRTREIEPRLPGEYRVLLVGDSYFFQPPASRLN